jgi:serine/threonine-protein kinase ULK2
VYRQMAGPFAAGCTGFANTPPVQVKKSTVAIKSVEVSRLNKKLKENLYGEIQILKSLRHPHIVALHDCIESRTHINLVMEYCELGDLSFFIKKRDKLETHPATCELARKYPCPPNSGLHEVVIRHFLKQLASALKFLRKMNYVHRDVKPQNLLLLPSPEYRKSHPRDVLTASHDSLIPVVGLPTLPMLKLADFGFARVLPSTSLADTLCGSPLYMAPEILRYERYDPKADLWSVGTVVYEMTTGRPPFKARNHVELLRRIEAEQDVIKFPRETVISSDLKAVIRALLKRNPVERMSFDKFFDDPVITQPIPGLVEDDIPKPALQEKRSLQEIVQRRSTELVRYEKAPRSPRETPAAISPLSGSPGSRTARLSQGQGREAGAGLGIRPQPQTVTPTTNRTHRLSDAARNRIKDMPSSPPASYLNDTGSRRRSTAQASPRVFDEREKAAQDVMDERDYVVIDKQQVDINALADAIASDRQTSRPTSKIGRRATQQGPPTSTTGAVAPQPSRAVQISQGKGHAHHASVDKTGTSPGSATSAISKAIQDASLRLFGTRNPPFMVGKGHSPPLPFPAYPIPTGHAGMISDGRQAVQLDEDSNVFHKIETYANRSDCVYGFAEVKYKQLFPVPPSMEHALGGIPIEDLDNREDGLTTDAVVTLSEEALVLYVKALALLAKAMDIATLWWEHRSRNDRARDTRSSQSLPTRINAAVQWVRERFNEVLEKTELVRLKLVDAQKQLPEDHPSHPHNHGHDSALSTGSGSKQVFLTPGISAEKLMYDRAIDMSRTAAIDEIANEHLEDCEAYYKTAIQMLEAVLDLDEDLSRVRSGSGNKDGRVDMISEKTEPIDVEDRQAVLKSKCFFALQGSISRF